MFKNIRLLASFTLAILLSFSVLFCTPVMAKSTCNMTSVNGTVATGALSIHANTAPGTVVKTVQNTSMMQCRDLSGQNTFVNHVDLTPQKALVEGYSDVYQTNINGLGVRYTFSAANCTNTSAVHITGTGKTGFDCPYTTGTSYVQYPLYANLEFVVTGTLPASATLTAVSEIKIAYTTSDSGGPWGQTSPISGVASGSMTAATC